MACGDPKARARVAILDPDLTATQPAAVAVQTGLDALAHALESAVCTRRNPLSELYSEAAFRHLARALGVVIDGRATIEDRGHMQPASSPWATSMATSGSSSPCCVKPA
jgi:alcohol dehydrogenase